MDRDVALFECEMCRASFQMGPHRYDGKHIQSYNLTVCKSCWEGNWDGWAPHREAKLIKHLNAKGMPIPPRNAKGWLPRE
jgi:hypothetical protein